MSETGTNFAPFEELRPRLMALLALHRAAKTEAAREALVSLLEEAFLATAWHVAHDLLEHGWSPGVVAAAAKPSAAPRLRLVGGSDAA